MASANHHSEGGYTTVQLSLGAALAVAALTAVAMFIPMFAGNYSKVTEETASHRDQAMLDTALKAALTNATAFRRVGLYPDDTEAVDLIFSYVDDRGQCSIFEVVNHQPNTTTADGTVVDEPYLYWRSGRYTGGTCDKAPSASTTVEWKRCNWTRGHLRVETLDAKGTSNTGLWPTAYTGGPQNPASVANYCTATNRNGNGWDLPQYSQIARVRYWIDETDHTRAMSTSVAMPWYHR